MSNSKFIRKLALGTVAAGLIFAPVLSLAEDQSADNSGSLVKKLVSDETVRLEDLGIENPGLLQTNPFYFIKDFRRSTQRTFLFNSLRRAELELDILNEKAAEIKFLEDINSEGADALAAALDNYGDTLSRLKSNLKNVKDNAKNPNVDQLLNNLLDRNLKHNKLFDQLKSKADIATKEKLDSLEDSFAEAAADSLNRFEDLSRFKERFSKILESQSGGAFKEWRAAEILNRTEEKTSYDSKLKGVLLSEKEDLILKTQVKIGLNGLNSVLPALFQLLPGDVSERIKILDEAREYLADSALKNDFGFARQLLLDLSAKSRNISKPEVEKLLSQAGETAGALRNQLLESRRLFINAFLLRAEFNLKQANESFKATQYISSFGQASIASAAAKNGLNQIFQKNNLENEIKNLKSDYDSLSKSSEKSGLGKEDSPLLFDILFLAEKSLIKISDLVSKDPKSEKAVLALRDAKVLIFKGGQILDDLLSRINEVLQSKKADQPLIEKVLPFNQEKENQIKKEAIQDLKKDNLAN